MDISNSIFLLSESKLFILTNSIISKIFFDEVYLKFPMMILINIIIGYLIIYVINTKFKYNSSIYIDIIIVSVILTYSLVLLRDVWVILFVLVNYISIKKNNYLIWFITLIILFDLRIFSFLLQIILTSKYIVDKKYLSVFFLSISLILAYNFLYLIDDFLFTYNKYRLAEIDEVSTSGITSLISNIIPLFWAIRITFLLSPVPTLLLKISSVYSLIIGISSMITLVWIYIVSKINFKNSLYYLIPIFIIAFTSAEVRHKVPYMLLMLVLFYGDEKKGFISN